MTKTCIVLQEGISLTTQMLLTPAEMQNHPPSIPLAVRMVRILPQHCEGDGVALQLDRRRQEAGGQQFAVHSGQLGWQSSGEHGLSPKPIARDTEKEKIITR